MMSHLNQVRGSAGPGLKGLFLVAGADIPSTRYRVGQFLPYFRRHGIECTVRQAYGHEYGRWASTTVGRPYKLVCRLKRGLGGFDASRFDFVFFQKLAIAESAFFESIAMHRNPRAILDFDDAIYLGPTGKASPLRARAFDRVVAKCARVVAGNSFLAARANAAEKTLLIPTVVDTAHYTPSRTRRTAESLVIGWMGTPSNFRFLQIALPGIRRILERHRNVIFRVVSNVDFPDLVGVPQVEQLRWSPDSELTHLQSFDIGIMPLVDTALTRGKCGFKMLLNLATSCPVVASAVGANIEILEGTGAGLLVREAEAWEAAIETLLHDRSQREEMGKTGRALVEERYSVTSVLDRYLRLFEAVSQHAA
ncbi:MAG: glycosyltransferase family 4 protein [Deltaproteobacteria bacterium]|nr:glycosyltransferase family 4 protein [Deltaproteobacteria bacterium]